MLVPRVSSLGGLSTPDRLSRIARECGASLIVMGGYGHSPMRELLYGGCTQAALEGGDLPVFILH
jgi:nucleotide-binding universal stress UspA family protein